MSLLHFHDPQVVVGIITTLGSRRRWAFIEYDMCIMY